MLKKIILKNFKCFREETEFPLGQLTLLTGINGRGKSTLLQSLLLMRQSIEHNDNAVLLVLNGSCVNLGSFNEIRNSNISRENPIIFKYSYQDNIDVPKNNIFQIIGSAQYHLNENYEDDMVAQISRIEFNDEIIECDSNDFKSISYKLNSVYEKSDECNQYLHPNRFNFIFSTQEKENKNNGSCSLFKLLPFSDRRKFERVRGGNLEIDLKFYKSLFFDRIHYISADRVGPQEFYLKSTLAKFPNVGAKGEFTANLLQKNKDYLVDDKLCLGEDAKTLATQTEEWLNDIFDGAKVEIKSSESNILELLMNSSPSKDRFRPANIGFGYHCVLPIIVSALIAKEGEILIVENPEAHLHPKAQSSSS